MYFVLIFIFTCIYILFQKYTQNKDKDNLVSHQEIMKLLNSQEFKKSRDYIVESWKKE